MYVGWERRTATVVCIFSRRWVCGKQKMCRGSNCVSWLAVDVHSHFFIIMCGCIVIYELQVHAILISQEWVCIKFKECCLWIIFTLKTKNFTNCSASKNIRDYSNYPVSTGTINTCPLGRNIYGLKHPERRLQKYF